MADLLRSGLVPADLRAALYRVLGKVPGLEITEQVANLDGKKGTAYGISDDGTRHDVIIDPATGQFIGERQITDEGFEGIPAGTVIGIHVGDDSGGQRHGSSGQRQAKQSNVRLGSPALQRSEAVPAPTQPLRMQRGTRCQQDALGSTNE